MASRPRAVPCSIRRSRPWARREPPRLGLTGPPGLRGRLALTTCSTPKERPPRSALLRPAPPLRLGSLPPLRCNSAALRRLPRPRNRRPILPATFAATASATTSSRPPATAASATPPSHHLSRSARTARVTRVPLRRRCSPAWPATPLSTTGRSVVSATRPPRRLSLPSLGTAVLGAYGRSAGPTPPPTRGISTYMCGSNARTATRFSAVLRRRFLPATPPPALAAAALGSCCPSMPCRRTYCRRHPR